MSKIHFIGGEKGGVGKSFTSRLLAQYHIDRQLPFIGFDTDQSHTTFSRFYGEFTSSIGTANEQLDAIIEEIEYHPQCNVIVDLAAQTADNLFQWMAECDFFGLMQECQIEVFFWHVLDDSADCKNLLQSTLVRLEGQPSNVVIVKNFGRSDNFGLLEQSPSYQQALALNATIITLDGLPAPLAQKIDFENLSFWAAAHNSNALSRVERHRLRVWIEKHYRQFDQALAQGHQPAGRGDVRSVIE